MNLLDYLKKEKERLINKNKILLEDYFCDNTNIINFNGGKIDFINKLIYEIENKNIII